MNFIKFVWNYIKVYNICISSIKFVEKIVLISIFNQISCALFLIKIFYRGTY